MKTQGDVLYISYDGMLEPLGQSQVLSYLRALAKTRAIHLISFEKARDWGDANEREKMRREIAAAGICWHPMRYHKAPSGLAMLLGVGEMFGATFGNRFSGVFARTGFAE